MTRLLIIGAGAAFIAGCAATPAPTPPPTVPPPPPCPVQSSAEWRAWVNAMPGPNSNPTLHITGKVTLPDGTWSVAFLPTSRVMESYPVQVVVDLDADPHGGGRREDPATHDVRGQWRSEAKVGSVTVMCRGTTLTRISPVETAY